MKKTTFQSYIGGHSARLADVVRNAVETYPHAYGDTIDVHSKRSQASLIHDHMVGQALRLLPHPEFHPVNSRQRSLFSYQDKVLLQFKKLRRNLTASNYPTRQAELFDQMGAVEGLPGMDADLPLVTVGYVPRPFLEGIEGIFVVHIVDSHPSWVWRLDENDDEQQNPVLSINPPNEPTRTTSKTRIKRPTSGDSATEQSA